ncbi:MAG: Lrp/AsnC ligand binding domain-containing protein [Euryarchaeota archaeon]|nr:Lrp/AsnC ligand binding domain-containing protein [Euryarchaeota archaeon]
MAVGLVLVRFVAGKEKAALAKIKNIKGVTDVKAVFGRWDAVVTAETEDVEAMGQLVVGKIRAIPGVSSTETLITTVI